ncbi:CG14516 [Drosophila busckii]|uniref:CG14516 n=1 Tax=Drosophila busckii TaxID=30019 RepID=A0A0M4F5M5_DROBS|nr:aminopeptidase N [Drosophila busckii]XP_017846523.1 aminopeptidase N [Drosophila busckii]ALC47212.1 CG14516 [Drosophila busckii]
MVVKEMPLHESLNMEQRSNANSLPTTTTAPTTTTFSSMGRRFSVSLTTAVLLASFFICTLLAVGFIVYNFATCAQLDSESGEDILCTKLHLRKANQLHGAKTAPKYDQDVRLPRSLQPLKYNLTIVPQMSGNFSFTGAVQINVLALEDCYNITMHAEELNITRNDVAVYRVLSTGSKEQREPDSLRIHKQYLVSAKQFFVIQLYDKLQRGSEYIVHIRFSGIIQDYLQGFYRSSYEVLNETRWVASTQFQATDARRAFPCFDEPALKANFTLHIARPRQLTTISNMPIVYSNNHESLPNYVWDHFAESLPMSTYLVAYAITDFTHISSGNFSVWARADAIKSAEYALSVGPKILDFLQNFFGVPFPLPKIDMIALPEFQAGAMENWGLITFRETAMLYEKGVAIASNKQRVATVVGHELAHQWFGNLVTPSWWTDIWLNEGFASYMEFLTANAVAPEWKLLDEFVVNELQTVFQLDALTTSHKISQEVGNPQEISEIFDRISYAKGSTVIRMMSHFLTDAVFRRGLSKYLREMAYKSATQDDLWRFLTDEAKASGLLDNSTSVKAIMDTWTLQTGYPVVKVSRHPNSDAVRLEQTRFVYGNSSKADEQLLWWIPITATTAEELNFENTRPSTWIPRTSSYELTNRNLSIAKWFIFNIQQTGYYRVNYDLDNWRAVTEHLLNAGQYTQIAPANRAQLLDDVLNLAKGSYLSYDTAMNLTRYLGHETNHVPWKAAITNFNFIDAMFVNSGDYDLLKNYLLKMLRKVYSEVVDQDSPAANEDVPLQLKRAEILNMACHLGHQQCISESNKQFQNWVQTPNPDAYNPINPNMRGIVYCSAIQYGSEYEWDFAFDRYLKTPVSSEKELLLSAMGCSKEPWILYRYLRRSIAGQHIRKQDMLRVFAAVSNTIVGQQIAFDFLRNNWQTINVYMGSQVSNIHTLLRFATKRMNSMFQLSELEEFVRHARWVYDRPIQQILEQVEVNVDWMNRNYKSIVKWLQEQQPESSLYM